VPDIHCFTVEPSTQKLLDLGRRAAATPANVLITGESGTGKSCWPGQLDEHSPRKGRAFAGASCSSLPRDVLESKLSGPVEGSSTGALAASWGKATAADGRAALAP
jgi:DNA-binding NtrC family response regulator